MPGPHLRTIKLELLEVGPTHQFLNYPGNSMCNQHFRSTDLEVLKCILKAPGKFLSTTIQLVLSHADNHCFIGLYPPSPTNNLRKFVLLLTTLCLSCLILIEEFWACLVGTRQLKTVLSPNSEKLKH